MLARALIAQDIRTLVVNIPVRRSSRVDEFLLCVNWPSRPTPSVLGPLFVFHPRFVAPTDPALQRLFDSIG